jgi:hypothetical protein
MSNLLKEAIADAKAVRETALANAKIALAEALRPEVENIFSKKIQEDIELDEARKNEYDDDEDEAEEDEEFVDESETQPEDLDSSGIGTGDNKVPSDHAKDTTDTDGDIKANESKHSESDDDLSEAESVDEDELNLDEIIAELEAELNEGDDEGPDDEEDDEDDESGDDDEVDESLNLDELLQALEELETVEEDVEPVSEIDELRAQLKQTQDDLTEHRDAVIFMRDKLNEINLLNAKLLYANKLFRSFDLNNDQKVRVIETLDRTSNSREVKLVYTTLAESLKFSTNITRKGTARNITEGLASKSIASTAPTTEHVEDPEILAEEARADRFKKLAGIIKG